MTAILLHHYNTKHVQNGPGTVSKGYFRERERRKLRQEPVNCISHFSSFFKKFEEDLSKIEVLQKFTVV